MELLKLSKFKLRLRALITEVRELRERERSTSDQIRLLTQKQQQSDEKSSRKLSELQSELALSNESKQEMEKKVSCLQNDNAMLESKQNELNETINGLLHSRDNFVKVYEDSTCEMKHAIESKDRSIALFSEKINTHISLFDSIQTEALSVKQVVDNVQNVLIEKEQVVAGLKMKVDTVSTFEKLFIDRINNLEKKLKSNDNELRSKNQTIRELEAQLDAEKNRENCQLAVKDLQESLSAKEGIIENLISEKKALLFELGSLNFFVNKIQDTVVLMNEEKRSVFSSVLRSQEECKTAMESETRVEAEDCAANMGTQNSPGGDYEARCAENTASLQCEENKSEFSANIAKPI